MPPKTSSQSGFALVQMAIVLLAIGVVVGATLAFMTPEQDKKHRAITMDRQRSIAVALTDFAQRNAVLPCPGDPAGTTPEAVGTARATCTTAALRVGVVPYRTLGLTAEDIMDAYDRPMTYAVQPEISTTNLGTAGTVYDACRTTDWIGIGGVNDNPRKANLCCRAIADGTRLRIFTDTAASVQAIPAQSPAPMALQQPDVPSTATGGTISYVAYVLVSHGKNGLGAYRLGNTARSPTTGANAMELNNATDDRDFVSVPLNFTAGTEYFDDIVLWNTQQHLIAETGSDSCAAP